MLSTKGLLDRCRTASSIDLSDDDQPDERSGSKLNVGQAAGWKEHTWSTFIARAEEEVRRSVGQNGKTRTQPKGVGNKIAILKNLFMILRKHYPNKEPE